jgi:protoporphyrinogen oxidase
MAGYGAAHRLHAEGIQSNLYDKNPYIGGHTASFVYDDGFIFDDGPHFSFTKDSQIRDLFSQTVQGEFETIQARVNNYYKGHWIKHPAQCNLYRLPEDLKVNCIKDFVESTKKQPDRLENYEDWLVASFGKTFARTFPCEYGHKYHTTTADNMSTVWLGPRLYRPDLEEVLRGALSDHTPDVHYANNCRYPTKDGFVSYLRPIHDKTTVHLGHEVTAVDPDEKILTFSNGKRVPFDKLISSIPLPELVPMVANCPADVVEASRRLACTTCVMVNIGIDREDVSEAHWTYFYEKDYFITRLSFPHMMSPNMAPRGCGSMQAEVYYSDKYRPMDVAPADCIEPVISDLRRCGLITDGDKILHKDVREVRYANVIFDLERERVLPIVREYLDSIGIESVGRYGEWGYLWTDEAFVSGERGAQNAIDRLGR